MEHRHMVYNLYLYLYLQCGKIDDNMENFRNYSENNMENIEIIEKLHITEKLQINEKL